MGLTRVPAAGGCHCWLAPAGEGPISPGGWLVFSSPQMSRHFPLICRVPEPVTVQSWLGLPLQVARVTGVSLTVESPVSATHLFARDPDTIGPETSAAALITDTVSSALLLT